RVSIFTGLATTTDPDHGVSPKYPGFVPGSNPGQYDEHMNRGAGIYAGNQTSSSSTVGKSKGYALSSLLGD
ncbi:unnamed protein product, partial [Brassica oleracea]